MISQEAILHKKVCDYLKIHHPNIIFRTDFAAGMRLNIGQARRHKALQSGRGFPDLFIAFPSNGFHGLFIELKKEGTRLVLKNGEYTSDKHIQEQFGVLYKLQELGYDARFAVGFNQAIEIIEDYLSHAPS